MVRPTCSRHGCACALAARRTGRSKISCRKAYHLLSTIVATSSRVNRLCALSVAFPARRGLWECHPQFLCSGIVESGTEKGDRKGGDRKGDIVLFRCLVARSICKCNTPLSTKRGQDFSRSSIAESFPSFPNCGLGTRSSKLRFAIGHSARETDLPRLAFPNRSLGTRKSSPRRQPGLGQVSRRRDRQQLLVLREVKRCQEPFRGIPTGKVPGTFSPRIMDFRSIPSHQRLPRVSFRVRPLGATDCLLASSSLWLSR
jgi:hypothetical protein